MKMLNFIRFAPCLALLFVTACATSTPPKTVENHSRFTEADATDVALAFYRWDTIYMTRPDSHENGFYPILTHDNVAAEINHRGLGHNLAVVVIGHIYAEGQEATLFHDWESILGDCGFHRVVFLRSGRGKNIDGLPIIHESVIATAHAEPKASATIAALPSAP